MLDTATTSLADDRVVFTLRTQLQKQIQLNQMADNKSHILLGLIIIPLSILSTRITDIELSVPQIWVISIFIVMELVALIQGVLVVRPRSLWLNYENQIEQMPNPFFFGYFTSYSEEDYLSFMETRLSDELAPGQLLLKDIYQIGLVLKRKYLLLKIAYFFAISGFVFAISAFLIFLLMNA